MSPAPALAGTALGTPTYVDANGVTRAGFPLLGEQERLDRGFSVNAPAEMSRLDRVAADDVVKTLGSERTRVATDRKEIELRVGVGRMGRELFPALILAVALVMAAEQLLANRFYDMPSVAGVREKVTSPKPNSEQERASRLVGGASASVAKVPS